jgi:capsid protein
MHDRINRGVTTVEQECARLGQSWQQVLAQQAAKRQAMQALGLGPHPVDLAS